MPAPEGCRDEVYELMRKCKCNCPTMTLIIHHSRTSCNIIESFILVHVVRKTCKKLSQINSPLSPPLQNFIKVWQSNGLTGWIWNANDRPSFVDIHRELNTMFDSKSVNEGTWNRRFYRLFSTFVSWLITGRLGCAIFDITSNSVLSQS